MTGHPADLIVADPDVVQGQARIRGTGSPSVSFWTVSPQALLTTRSCASTRRFGGYVITADQASSDECAMPAATIGRDDAVDTTLPVEEIGAHITQLVHARRR